MKKPAWLSMPVLDVRSLSSKQIEMLATAYDTLSEQNLDALADLHTDRTRHAIDDALAKSLKLPDLAHLRELLSREPGLNAKDINPRFKQAGLDLPEAESDEEEDDS